MKKLGMFYSILCLYLLGTAVAGFKVKLIKPKKPEQFMARTTVAGVTFAADLLLDGGGQKDFFYKELTPSNIIAVRLAVMNGGSGDVLVPLEGLQLIGPDGKPVPSLKPDEVAQAVLQGLVVGAEGREKESPVAVGTNTRIGDPRTDKTDPRYDPRLDPTDPSYDPTDPRSRGSRGRNYDGPWVRPGVDVVLNPGGGKGSGDLSQFEKSLVEKDFNDKAHSPEPVLPSLYRDRFLYFTRAGNSTNPKGYVLRLPSGKGIAQEVVLKF